MTLIVVRTKAGSNRCNLPLEGPEVNEEEAQEMTASLADANEISIDAELMEVLLVADNALRLKEAKWIYLQAHLETIDVDQSAKPQKCWTIAKKEAAANNQGKRQSQIAFKCRRINVGF